MGPADPAHDQYLVAHLRELLAQDHRVGDPNLTVTVAGGKVFVGGAVATVDRKDAVEEVAGAFLRGRPGYELCNEVEVRVYEEPEQEEHLR